ncbi:hypothetical protein [Streptomyces scopuliridis]|uniref:hypothetical protein n=1 Tax=Streptomyces scopuliridis TaxID=452529 RepID=UPI003676E5E1
MTPMPPIKIHVLDADEHDDDVALADVGVVSINGERHLFLSPQSFYSAVRQVKSAMPDLPMEQIERLVREHSEFKDFDELLGPLAEPAPPVDHPPFTQEPSAPVRPSGRAKKWAIAAALLPAFAGTWALGHFTGANPVAMTASAPDASPSTSSDNSVGDQDLGPEPFTARDFMDFSDAGKIDCNPIDNLEAECTDSDGMVMATKAATGPDSTIFTFSYGPERIGLRIFGDAEYAETWTRQDGSQELYPNMARFGRYVLWGTDKARLKVYMELLMAAPRKVPASHTMGVAEPLPPRLAALTLGTLGLNESDVHTILFAPQDASVASPVLMAAQAVLGVNNATPPAIEPGAEDIVALAAGLEAPPVLAGLEPAPPPSAETAAPSPTPVSDAKPTENGQTQKPVEEKPPEPAKTPTPEPAKTPTPEPETEPEEPAPPTPEPESPPAKPTEPEQPPTAPVDPAPPVTETPVPPQEPDPAETQPSGENSGTVEQPPATGEQAPADGDVDQDRGGGELLALLQAWIVPAA